MIKKSLGKSNFFIDDFRERLIKELDKMKIDPIKKDCVLELINIELKYPTTEKDAIKRYLGILEEKEALFND